MTDHIQGVLAGHGGSGIANRQSRLLKGAKPPSARPRRTVDEQRRALARYLTDRDRSIIRAVAGQRVLTTDQIADGFFDSAQRARMRLLDLYRLQVVDRFQPFRPCWGSNPYHYLLGRWGAALLAAEDDQDPDKVLRRWKADRALSLTTSQRLAHLVGIGGFYTSLLGRARRHDAAELVEWMNEADAAHWSDDIIRPDAYCEWREDGQTVELFLEYDRGTETLSRLVGKLPGYERFEAERGGVGWVLFAFESPRREAAARRTLAGATVPVATATLSGDRRPHNAIWRPITADDRYVRLAGLAVLDVPRESRERTKAQPLGAWRYRRSRERRLR